MKLSRRAKRMERHHKRAKRIPGLNLVSLMDIFTILVFFLLVSSGEVEELPNSNAIKLPESIAMEKPRESLVIMVTNEEVIILGKTVASVFDILASEEDVIPEIKAALERVNESTIRRTTSTTEDNAIEREATIMGDRDIPYKVLKKIMASCTAANYNHISLAVVKKTNLEG
ncbi:hypothetical protein MNBD_GAMMA16-1494 [hydrothermal vent metagenome]|uniref:Adventurous gliding motility protein S n=1 Tax=hydrothermal vent metagenome TaxID=652676 RepID=A0A3B0Z9U0_9ZZZZ